MARLDWTADATALDGDAFARFQTGLSKFNHNRLTPTLPADAKDWRAEVRDECAVKLAEGEFVEAARAAVAHLVKDVPNDVDAFIAWYENLTNVGPGQGDPLFPWLAKQATLPQMKWFLSQEVAGEAGFEDLLSVTQVKIPERAKLEMARNYWDEMGRGNAKGMHGPMLERLAQYFEVDLASTDIFPEPLALSNVMIALASNRRYSYQSIGALGIIEQTAPARAAYVNQGLKRLKVSARQRTYFALHSILDVKHSAAWNAEVLRPLVTEKPACAQAIAEGAVLRLWCGARCFDRYREHFGLHAKEAVAA